VKSQEEQHQGERRQELMYRSSQRRKKTKVEAFEKLEFFQVPKKVQKLRREHSSCQIGKRRKSRPLVSTSRKGAQEERTRRMDLNQQI
jgi:hypothetical protein